MNDVKELKERYSTIYPGFGSYTECMSRSLFSGLAAGAIVFSGTWIFQHLFRHRLPYDPKFHALVSAAIGVVSGYKVTALRSQSCQAAWMATENKHTYLNPLQKEEKQISLEKPSL
ncbi:transmembrane protein 141-like [Artemia franciscana]|uniref:Transmembrane protein 141 n=1 Tax=Artemia franciscana TaxID=6661 RepID=A0AA88HG03_ARTSF|nr:hypothetical protein QYM36_016818 [Artemia franciscana]